MRALRARDVFPPDARCVYVRIYIYIRTCIGRKKESVGAGAFGAREGGAHSLSAVEGVRERPIGSKRFLRAANLYILVCLARMRRGFTSFLPSFAVHTYIHISMYIYLWILSLSLRDSRAGLYLNKPFGCSAPRSRVYYRSCTYIPARCTPVYNTCI